ncbi:MAG: hypothetical protein V2B20_11400 [Pseudomonadota bacterium]
MIELHNGRYVIFADIGEGSESGNEAVTVLTPQPSGQMQPEKLALPAFQSTTGTSGSTQQNQNSTTTGLTSSTTTSSSTGTSSSDSTTSGTSTTDSVLPMADSKTTRQKGKGGVGQLGIEYKRLGAYQNSEEISSNDLQYLSGLLQTYLFLRGVNVVPPSEAEIDVYVTIDVFGTVRSRVELVYRQ